MSARDQIHRIVEEALRNDGWTITHDPLTISVDEGNDYFQIDLGAEKIITAEKGKTRIAVEVKSFARSAVLYDFHDALGQFIDYRDALMESEMEADRILYLAISRAAWHNLSGKKFIQRQIRRYQLKFVVIRLSTKRVESWIE